MLRYWSLWHPTVTFRRAAALASGNYGDEKPVEDYSLWLRLARVGRLANLPDCLLDYRLHEQSVTESFIRSGLLSSSIAKCIPTHGHPLYSISEARLFELASGGIQLGLRDVLTLTKSLVSKGHCSMPGLLRSGYTDICCEMHSGCSKTRSSLYGQSSTVPNFGLKYDV